MVADRSNLVNTERSDDNESSDMFGTETPGIDMSLVTARAMIGNLP